MLVQDIVDLAKIKLQNLTVSKNDSALIKFTFLGVSELFRRFNLSIKAETILVNENLAMYELRNSDVSMLLGIYDITGRELTQTDIYNSQNYDYKMVNYKSFLLRKPFNGILYTVYKASPTVFKDMNEEIDLPDSMIDALLCYICYMSHTTINKNNVNESNVYQQRFDIACKELESQGYKIPLNSETLSLHTKGYI